jgi:hypothetical protein
MDQVSEQTSSVILSQMVDLSLEEVRYHLTGLYYHNRTVWKCKFCGDWARLPLDVKHNTGCPIPAAENHLRELGMR